MVVVGWGGVGWGGGVGVGVGGGGWGWMVGGGANFPYIDSLVVVKKGLEKLLSGLVMRKAAGPDVVHESG